MIYIVRHGLDDESYIGGWSDVDLIKEGISQVKETCKYIKKHNIKFDKIYSSDIKRAISTSNIIKDELEIDTEIIKTPLLRELNKGILNGMLEYEALCKFPYLFNKVDVDTIYPNGESLKSFYLRIRNDINKILKFENSLLVTHRGVINMFYFILNDLPLSTDKEMFLVSHGSLHEYDVNTNKIKKLF